MSKRLTDISYVRTLLGEAETGFKKRYGQNFLINPAVPQKIAEVGIPSGEFGVLEIGPGIGTLTVELAARAKSVVAVEIDGSLLPILAQTLADFANAEVINADAMKLDIPFMCAEKFGNCKGLCVCANLPYYITTPILMRLIECGAPFSRITVMVQSEVADRLTAAPGTAVYGAITASIAYHGVARRAFSVSSGSFMPAPKVDSAVVTVDMYTPEQTAEKFGTVDEKTLRRVISGAFGQRRKTLLNALTTEFPELGKERVAEIIRAANIAPEIRGERLGIADFCRISEQIKRK